MFFELFVLLIAGGAWIALLWLAIAPDFTAWSNPGLIAAHALPPLTIWLVWVVVRRRNLAKKAEETQLREAQAQAERDAARETARQKHDEEMQQRRFGCDCRIMTIAGLRLNSELPLLKAVVENVDVRSLPLDEARESASDTILDNLALAMKDALGNVYSVCGAASLFPIFVTPPADVAGELALATVRTIHADIVDMLKLPVKLGANVPSILFLPTANSASNSIISLFETTPDLPGAVVLAFDSPLTRAFSNASFGDDEFDPARQKKEQQTGKPSEGVVALLLTNRELPSMLKTIAGLVDSTDDHDSMTPYWQKSMHPGGNLALLSGVSVQLREELAQLPVLGCVHRAVFREVDRQPAGVLEMTRILQNSLEQAQISAGLIDVPFTHDGTAATDTAPDAEKRQPQHCRWLVHNAGGVDFAGKRLAALGAAMYYFNIDLNPVDVDMSTNIVTHVGDLGRATGISQLALSVAHAAEEAAPALCAEFSDDGGVAVSFVTPPAPPI